MVDWDKENYFSLMNVRRRKFEKERLEQQERRDAERVQKQELQARQEEVARVEEARLKMEQMAAALRWVSLTLNNLMCLQMSCINEVVLSK